MDWITGTLTEFLGFLRADPGLGLVVLAVLMIAGRKAYRHISKTSQYTLRELKNYPGEWLEIGFILLVALVGLLKFTGVF